MNLKLTISSTSQRVHEFRPRRQQDSQNFDALATFGLDAWQEITQPENELG